MKKLSYASVAAATTAVVTGGLLALSTVAFGAVTPPGPTPTPTPTPSLPTITEQCKKGGWENYGDTFKNHGDCVSFVATDGENAPSGSEN